MTWIVAAVNALQSLLDDIAISLKDTAHVRVLDWERGNVVFEYADRNASCRIPLRAGTEREQEHVAALRQRVESLDAVHESLSSEQESRQRATNELIVVTPHNNTSLIAIPQATFEQLTPLSTNSICSFSPSIEITDAALALHTEPLQIPPNDRALSALRTQARDVSSLLPSASSERVESDRRGADATNTNLNQPEGVAVSIRRIRVASVRHRKVKRRLSDVLWLFYLAEHLRFPLFFALINAWHKVLEQSICSNVALKRRCRERNLGPKEIELLIGVSPQRLVELEEMCPPTWDEVVDFSDLLECSPEFLWPGWRQYVVLGEEIPIAHLDKRDIVWDGDPYFEAAAPTVLCVQLSEVLESLPEKERFVIVRYFGLEGYSARVLREIGAEMRVTSARIAEIKEKALRHLRHPVRKRVLQDYLKQG